MSINIEQFENVLTNFIGFIRREIHKYTFSYSYSESFLGFSLDTNHEFDLSDKNICIEVESTPFKSFVYINIKVISKIKSLCLIDSPNLIITITKKYFEIRVPYKCRIYRMDLGICDIHYTYDCEDDKKIDIINSEQFKIVYETIEFLTTLKQKPIGTYTKGAK
jgi:hypothetical protein